MLAGGLEALGGSSCQVIVGTTYNWDTDANISSSGTKLYIRTHPVGRNVALAKAVALLKEEDFDEMPYLLVVYRQQK